MQLDTQQQAAVLTSSKTALVIAGAGSGKTRVLVERIAHLIEHEKVSAFDIMAITFTRKAAGEMRERLEKRIGREAHKLTIGTMHAMALQQIKRFGDALGLKPSTVTVYSEFETGFMIKEIAKDLGLFKGKSWKIPKKEVDQMFAGYWERGEQPQEVSGALLKLFHSFLSRCRENNSMPYGSLLTGLEGLVPIMRKFANIQHVLVDECQDLDPLQWAIINDICFLFEASLFAVGDIDQSIYEFRGAVPKYLFENQDLFDIYRLENNYRSDAAIVKAANNLIRHNTERLDKTMQPVRGESLSSVHTIYDMDSAEIVKLVKTYKCDAVMARNHFLLESLTRELDAAGVAHEYVGQKSRITATEEFRRFHAFLKLMINPMDNFSFLLIKELIGLSAQEYTQIRLQSVIQCKSHFQTWYDSVSLVENNYAVFFNSQIYRESLGGASLALRSASQGAHPWPEIGWGDMDIEPTCAFIFSWLSKNQNGTIGQYLDWLATYDIHDEITTRSAGKLQILTIHAAKGLEWPMVIIAGCNEGILPSTKADAAGEIEAERRLMYVAMTRAQDDLIMAVRPESKESQYGKVYNNPISRFCTEADGE
jgi:DNA helicase-2/ATP-dependent DNA helicase PcrA